MLTKEKIAEYKEILEGARKSVLAEIAEEEKPVDFGADIDSLEEETDEAEETENKMAAARALKERLNEIEGALKKIEAGRFGICENCGQEISKEVLEVVPESQLCKNCKQKRG